jgi:hypothetical protein
VGNEYVILMRSRTLLRSIKLQSNWASHSREKPRVSTSQHVSVMKEFFFIVGTLHEPNAGRCRVAEHG